MPLGQRQLFIYWRVAGSDLPAALHALRDWQSGLIAQHPAPALRAVPAQWQLGKPMPR